MPRLTRASLERWLIGCGDKRVLIMAKKPNPDYLEPCDDNCGNSGRYKWH